MVARAFRGALPSYYTFFIPIPSLSLKFFLVLAATLAVDVININLYAKAFEESSMSIALPFFSFSPIFTTIIGFFILKELPTMFGIFGIIFVVAGAYIINSEGLKNGLMTPFMRMFRERGPMLMLGAAFMSSIAASLGKILLIESSPLFFSATYFSFFSIAFIPLVAVKVKNPIAMLRSSWGVLLPMGMFFGASLLFHALAISSGLVAYVISVKRVHILFGVLFGLYFFGEGSAARRIAATALMLAGILLMTLF